MASTDTPHPVKALFQAVVDLAPAERAAWLDEHCSDEAVRAEVDQLIALHDADTATALKPALEQLAATVARRETDFATFETLDEFRILRKLGEGGMAVVYLAEDTTLQRLVALKVLPSAFTGSEQRVARFRQEAVTIAQLHHDGIVPVHRVGKARGVYYIAMEYVEGMTLAATLDDLKRLPRAEAQKTVRAAEHLRREASLVALVADALDYTHRHEIVHRDVKPSNIIIDEQGRPRLMDFGIARDLNQVLTSTGQFAGTYPYMSPEQARAASTAVDRRTDVFSLGVVLYEAVTLELPFRGSTAQEILDQIIAKQPRRLRLANPSASRDLETICHKALEKNPVHRYQTAAHMAADLRCYVDDRPILARPPSVYRKTRVWVRDHKLRSLVALAAVLLAGVLALALLLAAERRSRMGAVSVTTDRPEATVFARQADPATLEPGPRAELGPAPLDDRLMPQGQYRFTVVAGGDFAEAAVLVEAGASVSLNLLVPSDDRRLHEDMVLLEGRTYRFGRPDEQGTLAPREIDLPAFWIDRYEVSNEQYLAFVEATGHPQPEHWHRFGYDPALADRPVVGITAADAQSYARWRGKRLPTVFEWETAMRAPDDRLLPWGAGQPAGLHEVDIEDMQRMRATRWDWGYEQYVKHARPVRSDPQLATAAGLFHAATNVSELTESLDFDKAGAAIVKGASWLDPPAFTDLTHNWLTPATSVSLYIGFRCARSAQP